MGILNVMEKKSVWGGKGTIGKRRLSIHQPSRHFQKTETQLSSQETDWLMRPRESFHAVLLAVGRKAVQPPNLNLAPVTGAYKQLLFLPPTHLVIQFLFTCWCPFIALHQGEWSYSLRKEGGKTCLCIQVFCTQNIGQRHVAGCKQAV